MISTQSPSPSRAIASSRWTRRVGNRRHANFIFPALDPFAEPHHIRDAAARVRSLCMLRRVVTYLVVLSAGLLITSPSSARERRHIDATPSLHAPCSVLSG